MTEETNSYLPLFRKYRPQSFKDVIGQEFTVRALQNAIKLNKIANAYLFSGPRGTGKTSCARIFAKSLNCKEGPTVEPCQKCQSCLDVTNASGLDVIEIDAATNRGIDDAKELINKVQYAPMNGKYKIFIIDEVHMLSKEAFNALLKTFEEPPKNVIFILATTEPHKIIETIVSRCQRFDFRRITVIDIQKRLREISDLEKINITDDALFQIAKNVSGGMRDSLALLDQASILGLEKQITKETIEELTGKLTFDSMYDLTDIVLKGEINPAVKAVEKIYEKGSEPRNFIENYIEFLRNVVLILNSKNDEEIINLTLLSKENIQKIRENKNFEGKKLIRILDKVIEFYKEIKVSTNPYLWAELAVINVTAEDETKHNTAAVSNAAQNIIQKTPVIKKTAPEANSLEPEKQVEKYEEKYEEKPAPPPVQAAQNKNTPPLFEQTLEEDVHITAKESTPASFNEPTENKKAETETAPSLNTGDPAKIWAEILNRVESIPAKFFYSGVGKLVGIENNKITLGFVNQNAVTQAKSENKFNPLMKAIKAVLSEDGQIEFITVTKDTKIIDTKMSVKINSAHETPRQPDRPVYGSFDKPSPAAQAPASVHNVSDKSEINNTDDFDTPDITSYTRVTREMLETYNGRVVE